MHSKLLKAVSCGLAIGLACTSTSAAEVIVRDKFEHYSLEGFGTLQKARHSSILPSARVITQPRIRRRPPRPLS